jgi:hypothetical protein
VGQAYFGRLPGLYPGNSPERLEKNSNRFFAFANGRTASDIN